MSSICGSGPEIKHVFARKKKKAPVLKEAEIVQDNENKHPESQQTNTSSVSKDEILEEKNTDISSIFSIYAHQSLEAANSNSEGIRGDESAVACDFVAQKSADMEEENMQKLCSSQNQVELGPSGADALPTQTKKNTDESSILSTYAHQNLEAANSEGSHADESADLDTLSADKKQSAAAVACDDVVAPKTADIEEENKQKLCASQNQVELGPSGADAVTTQTKNNKDESSILSTYADHNIEAANSEGSHVDESADLDTLYADKKQLAAAVACDDVVAPKTADIEEEYKQKLCASQNQVELGPSGADALSTTQTTQIDLMEALLEQEKVAEQSDLISELKVEIQNLQSSDSSELVSIKHYETTNFELGTVHNIAGRLNQYSDMLTDLNQRVTNIEANQVKLMSDIADIKIMLLSLIPHEGEEKKKGDDVKKRDKGMGTEYQQKSVNDVIELVEQVDPGINFQAKAGHEKNQYEKTFVDGPGLKCSSSSTSTSSTRVIVTSEQLTTSNPTACEGKDKGKGVVVEESKKIENAYVPMPNLPQLLGDSQETRGYINPVEMVTTTGEKKLAYHTSMEFVANDEEIARKLHEEEFVSQQSEQEKWEITKQEKIRRRKLMGKREQI